MGCDGGTIPTRDELVRLKKKPEKIERDIEWAAKWKHCALSQQPLHPPLVACQLGRIYNKDCVIELLLDRSKYEDPAKVQHIRALKDVCVLNLTENPVYKDIDDKGALYVTRANQYICPITGLEMAGRYKFQFLWVCGCVFAERALKEVKGDTCNKCGKDITTTDVITLNGTDEEIAVLRAKMEDQRAKAKLAKKAKKKKAAEALGCADEASSSKQPKLDTAEKLTNGGSRNKGLQLTNGSNGHSSKLTNGKTEKEKKYKSVQNDPTASKAYKSLFITSEEAKKKGTAHWVTHNPFYN